MSARTESIRSRTIFLIAVSLGVCALGLLLNSLAPGARGPVVAAMLLAMAAGLKTRSLNWTSQRVLAGLVGGSGIAVLYFTSIEAGQSGSALIGLSLALFCGIVTAIVRTAIGSADSSIVPESASEDTSEPIPTMPRHDVDQPALSDLESKLLAGLDDRIVDEENESDEVSTLELGDLDETVTQSWQRRQSRDGERLEGQVRVRFAAGERRVVLHVPIAPAFQTVPECFCEPEDPSRFAAETDTLRPYGIRTVIRRCGESNSEATTLLWMVLEGRRAEAKAA